MEGTSFRGNKFGITVFFVLALSLCSVAGTYRLKKIAEIKKWEKNYDLYSQKLESENKDAIHGKVIMEAE